MSAVAVVFGVATGCTETTPEPQTGPPAQYLAPPPSETPVTPGQGEVPGAQPQERYQPQPQPQEQYQPQPQEQYQPQPQPQPQPQEQIQPQPQMQPQPQPQPEGQHQAPPPPQQRWPQFREQPRPQVYAGPFGPFNPRSVTTIAGVVVSVQAPSPGPGARPHVVLTVRTGNDTMLVDAGPSWYLHQRNVVILPGDPVLLTGSRTTFRERPVLIATRVVQGDRVLDLRHASGRPVWWGQGAR